MPPVNKHALKWLEKHSSEAEWLMVQQMKDDSEKLMSWLADIAPAAHAELSRLWPAPSSLTIRFDVPKLTEAQIVSGKPLWRSLEQVARDEAAAKLKKNEFIKAPEVELYSEAELRAAGLWDGV